MSKAKTLLPTVPGEPELSGAEQKYRECVLSDRADEPTSLLTETKRFPADFRKDRATLEARRKAIANLEKAAPLVEECNRIRSQPVVPDAKTPVSAYRVLGDLAADVWRFNHRAELTSGMVKSEQAIRVDALRRQIHDLEVPAKVTLSRTRNPWLHAAERYLSNQIGQIRQRIEEREKPRDKAREAEEIRAALEGMSRGVLPEELTMYPPASIERARQRYERRLTELESRGVSADETTKAQANERDREELARLEAEMERVRHFHLGEVAAMAWSKDPGPELEGGYSPGQI